jgi:hypothetical protein
VTTKRYNTQKSLIPEAKKIFRKPPTAVLEKKKAEIKAIVKTMGSVAFLKIQNASQSRSNNADCRYIWNLKSKKYAKTEKARRQNPHQAGKNTAYIEPKK